MISSNGADGAGEDAFAMQLAVLHSAGGFLKMHGLGNDFIIVDGRERPFRPDKSRIENLCNRSTGIGGDQLLVIERPRSRDENVFLRIYNIDGREAETCLNATRCVALLALKESGAEKIRIGTLGGVIEGYFGAGGDVTLRLPAARLDWRSIPLSEPRDTLALNLRSGPLTAQVAVNLGNPHIVCFVASYDDVDVRRWAPDLQRHPILPEGANVGVAEIVDDTRMKLVVWERPGLLTSACGSGACAALVAARRSGLTTASRMTVVMPGGTLVVEEASEGTLFLTGAAEISFPGFLPVTTDVRT